MSLDPQAYSASMFEVFINIHEYANEIIFILDHWMKGLIKSYHWCVSMMILNHTAMVVGLWFGAEDCYLLCFYEFTSFVRFLLIFMNMQIR